MAKNAAFPGASTFRYQPDDSDHVHDFAHSGEIDTGQRIESDDHIIQLKPGDLVELMCAFPRVPQPLRWKG